VSKQPVHENLYQCSCSHTAYPTLFSAIREPVVDRNDWRVTRPDSVSQLPIYIPYDHHAYCLKIKIFQIFQKPKVTTWLLGEHTIRMRTWEVCLAYLDDLVIFASIFKQHLQRCQMVLDRIVEVELKHKLSKCLLFQKKVKFLRSIISEDGIEPDPEKVLQQWQNGELKVIAYASRAFNNMELHY